MPRARPPAAVEKQARRLGASKKAEDAVVEYLQAQGFDVAARNLRLGHLEVDIVGLRDGLAVLVEVRTRGATAYEKPLASVAGKKKMRLLHAADRLWRGYLSKRPDVARMRIDVAGVTFGVDGSVHIEYIPGAITA
ncbi:YraN family protein [Pendulispora brunnea]|uniref:YraN family protein n=1 Tax=Pendulispora brunnea TaxID=2905690 RepID=A0ABZ2K3U5_9BACT